MACEDCSCGTAQNKETVRKHELNPLPPAIATAKFSYPTSNPPRVRHLGLSFCSFAQSLCIAYTIQCRQAIEHYSQMFWPGVDRGLLVLVMEIESPLSPLNVPSRPLCGSLVGFGSRQAPRGILGAPEQSGQEQN